MRLLGIESETAARDLCTFECARCGRLEVRGVTTGLDRSCHRRLLTRRAPAPYSTRDNRDVSVGNARRRGAACDGFNQGVTCMSVRKKAH